MQPTGDYMELNLWAFGDAHIATDLKHGRESLRDAITHSEFGGPGGAAPFGWDIAVNIGDMSGKQAVPDDEEGRLVVSHLRRPAKHRREDIYSVCGNHDRSGLDEEPNIWWRRWIDPTGEYPEYSGVDSKRRKYPIKGTWERYSFQAGNILFLMMSDINPPSQSIGRGSLGGNPGGAVSEDTFLWWKRMVEENQDKIIVSVHHYMLKDTTTASGAWEGMEKDADGNWVQGYHGYYPEGSPEGASYLYWVGSTADAQKFENYLAEHPGAIDLWIGGHTHIQADDVVGGKGPIERKWGVHFINTGALTKYHIGKPCTPMSRLLTFRERNNELQLQTYLHDGTIGFSPRHEHTLSLSTAAQLMKTS